MLFQPGEENLATCTSKADPDLTAARTDALEKYAHRHPCAMSALIASLPLLSP
jgi:hypothetical protein